MVVASANVKHSNDAEDTYTWLSAYALQKTITFPEGLGPGTFRTYFEIRGVNAASKVYGKVYKNGTAIGTARTTTGTSYAGWYEDFNGPLNPGDTIELWIKNSGSSNCTYCRNFHVKFDYGTTPTALYAVTV